MEIRSFTTRRVVYIAVVAALYTVLTVALAPVSYSFIQFRVSEALKVFVLFDPWLSLGIGVGTFFANMASPYVGPWELIWMPITDMIGGILAWAIYKVLGGKLPAIPMAIYAITTGLAVGIMLYTFGLGAFWVLSGAVVMSEFIILIGGLPMMMRVGEWLKNQR